MIDLKNVILFCTALIIVAKILEVKCDLETEAPKHCGQYGFRCVEKHSFEICNAPDSDGYLDPDEVHNCAKDTACDEDNPAYCSPEDESFFKVGSCRSIRNANNMKLALHDDIDNEENEPDLTTIVSTTDKDELNNCEEEKYTEAPAFECEAQGFFADSEDKSLFYYCDLKNDGVGFILRHMKCGKNRIFDHIRRECTLIGSTRNIRDESEEREADSQHIVISVRESDSSSINNCSLKIPGKYADPNNCHNYILCLSSELYHPFEQLTVQCPKRTAYDPHARTCTKLALSRCFGKQKIMPRSAINCQNSMRFREIESTNSYYLCYKDQVVEMNCPVAYAFNDQTLRCVPEKWLN